MPLTLHARATPPGGSGLKHLAKAPETRIPAGDFIGQMTSIVCPEVVDTVFLQTDIRRKCVRNQLAAVLSILQIEGGVSAHLCV
jgi:hypothetical protein